MLFYYSILSTFNILPHILFNAHVTLPAIFILHYQTKLVLTWSHPCKLSCPATSRSSLPHNPLAISPALSRQLTCIYTCCMQLQNQTCSAPQACTTTDWGCLLSCSSPFCSPCTFVYLLSSNLYQSYHCTYFHKVSCTSPAPHLNLCTSMHAPHLMHISSCTS